MDTLTQFGWNELWEERFDPYQGDSIIPVRITREGKDLFHGMSREGNLILEIGGSLRNLVQLGVSDYPVIGDWCAVNYHSEGRGIIETVLPRERTLHRPISLEAGRVRKTGKPVAANIDLALIVIDVAFDGSLRRAERFLSLLESDDIPSVLILSKADLASSPEEAAAGASERLPNTPVLLVDSISHKGKEKVETYCLQGKTVVILGASGAGKSTLINMLAGKEISKTGETRISDGEGRHTTTARQLYHLENGALLLDTPGIRAVGTYGSQNPSTSAFSDISSFAEECRFSDCTHTSEPGCAVRRALKNGEIDQDSYDNFLIIQNESMGKEEMISKKREKEKEIARIKYHMRRGS